MMTRVNIKPQRVSTSGHMMAASAQRGPVRKERSFACSGVDHVHVRRETYYCKDEYV